MFLISPAGIWGARLFLIVFLLLRPVSTAIVRAALHVQTGWAVAPIEIAGGGAAVGVACSIAPLLRRTALRRQDGFGAAEAAVLHVEVAHRHHAPAIEVVEIEMVEDEEEDT